MRVQKNKGFTLVELLVVIAIIGVLSSVILAAMTSARAKGRDGRRISDVKALQGAIELYRDGNKGKAPAALADLVTTYIARVPDDPTNEGSFVYTYARGGATAPDSFKYYIKFVTETDTAQGVAGTYCANSKDIVPASAGACTAD